MKKLGIVLIIILAIGGITFLWNQNIKKEDSTEKNYIREEKKDLFVEILEGMRLEEKIGQMLFIAHREANYEESFLEDVKNYKPGGCILFGENITSYQSAKKFIQKLQDASSLPLFIGTDQEGGSVQRFKTLPDQSFTLIPPMQRIGDKNDATISKKVGNILGSELASLGINVDFAPVLDINSNPSNTVIGARSFGSSKELVTTMGLALAKGLKEEGVIPVYKHFPGHGDTYEDSHQDFANIYKTKEDLLNTELYPFSFAAKETDAMIMMGHLSLPNILEDQTPASLSATIIELLKKELGFQGVIISDALNMGALTKHYKEEEILINAVNAGVDILLMPNNTKAAVEILTKAVTNGTISKKRIDEAVLKILKLKKLYHLFDEKNEKILSQKVWKEHQNFIQKQFN